MKKIKNLQTTLLLFLFCAFGVQAQIQTEIKDANGHTTVETARTNNVIHFKVGNKDVFRMIDNRLEPVGTGNSIFIGNLAGDNDDLSNNNGVFIGDLSGQFNTTGSNNAAIGANSLRYNTTGSNNAAIGPYSLFKNTTASNNISIGAFTLYNNTTGSSNSAIGTNSLSFNTTGSNNAGIGIYSLGANTTGSNNAAIGANSLRINTTGSFNAAIGTNSLSNNTTGYSNAGIGTNSLLNNSTGYSNAGIGTNSLRLNTTGSNNVGIGNETDYNNTAGSNNTILGAQAGRGTASHSKSGNVFIGYQAGYSEVNSNKLYIENSNDVISPLVYGDFANNQLAIGTSTPKAGYTLSVNGKGIFTEVRVLEFANWPDYVFLPEYNLKTIEEVEHFIFENGHLPNIPSAKTVEQEGIALGDMDKNLLEKIEELTLYMIKINKQIKNLQSENEKLKKEISLIKKEK